MSTTKVGVNKIATVVIPVSDQDRVIEFYVEKLGFEKRVDVPFAEGMRWVEVGLGERRRHSRLGEIDTGIGLTIGIRHPGKGMQHPNVSCFAKLSWPGDRIVDVSFPRKTAEDESQAAKFKEARRR